VELSPLPAEQELIKHSAKIKQKHRIDLLSIWYLLNSTSIKNR
jgi:hypothetical protein